VTESLRELLLELEQFGLSNDGTIADRPRRILNITRDTGEFLSVLELLCTHDAQPYSRGDAAR
jgi:hypothetical protein